MEDDRAASRREYNAYRFSRRDSLILVIERTPPRPSLPLRRLFINGVNGEWQLARCQVPACVRTHACTARTRARITMNARTHARTRTRTRHTAAGTKQLLESGGRCESKNLGLKFNVFSSTRFTWHVTFLIKRYSLILEWVYGSILLEPAGANLTIIISCFRFWG